MNIEASNSAKSGKKDSFRITLREDNLDSRPLQYGVVADIWDDYLDVWGESIKVNGRRDFIYFKFPAGIKDGSYSLSQFDAEKGGVTDNTNSSVWVYAIFGSGAGVLVPESGKIHIKWNLAERELLATFEFTTKVGPRVYTVTQGRVEVVIPEAQLSNGEGEVRANITPPLPDGHDAFVADTIAFQPFNENSWFLRAYQTVNSYSHQIWLRIPSDYKPGDPLSEAVFYGYSNILFSGEDLNVSKFSFDQTQRTLKAEFSFSFSRAGVRYEVQNVVVDIRY